jgi:hypothetical protein
LAFNHHPVGILLPLSNLWARLTSAVLTRLALSAWRPRGAVVAAQAAVALAPLRAELVVAVGQRHAAAVAPARERHWSEAWFAFAEPAPGGGPPLALPLCSLISGLTYWRGAKGDQPGRPEAIRRLVERALFSGGKGRAPRQATAEKAAELADRALEKVTDKSQPTEEQKTRKRKLIRGPTEFRDIRRDQPGRKD